VFRGEWTGSVRCNLFVAFMVTRDRYMWTSGHRIAHPLFWLGLISVCLLGCSTPFRQYKAQQFKVGPEYCVPKAEVADDWLDSGNPTIQRDSGDIARWWQIFNDPTLDRLVELANEQNITLREAYYRVSEAEAQRRIVAGWIFPQSQSLSGDYTRIQRSSEVAIFPRGMPPNSPFANLAATSISNWRYGGSLAWELDFWGRYRRAIESADARLDATIEGYREVQVILVAQVVGTYVEWRTVEQQIAVANENAELQRESVRVATARFNEKADGSELDSPQAKANLSRTMAVLELLQARRQQALNRLAILLGQPPQDLSYYLEGALTIPEAPEALAIGVPAELIWRRPDVRRAERMVAAQSAEIGIAESELYPHISIAGTAGWEAGTFPDLFKSGALAGTIGPGFRWNVLNYGRLLNNIEAQNARFQQAIANYQQSVLKANEEAENAITAFLHFKNQVQLLGESVKEAREAERVAEVKYREGEIDFNRLFVVQQLLLGQQEALTSAKGAAAQSLVELYRALGGGWENSQAREIISSNVEFQANKESVNDEQVNEVAEETRVSEVISPTAEEPSSEITVLQDRSMVEVKKTSESPDEEEFRIVEEAISQSGGPSKR
jgi:NodT family efflux transporter outer membrane factor (OMF) lipoprotein